MCLGDFSSLLETGAALNLAFVVVEYTKSYTSIIARKIYQIDDRIKNIFEECLGSIDKTAVLNLKPYEVNGQSTVVLIEELKKRYYSVYNKTRDKKNALKAIGKKACHFRSFSCVSLYLGMYAIVGMFVSGFREYCISELFWMIFSFISLLLMILYFIVLTEGWCQKYSESLRAVINVFIVACILSMVISGMLNFFHPDIVGNCMYHNELVAPLSALSLFVDFILFALIVKVKVRSIIKKAESEVKNLKSEWDTIKSEVDKHIIVEEVSSNMTSISSPMVSSWTVTRTDTTDQQKRKGSKEAKVQKRKKNKKFKKHPAQ